VTTLQATATRAPEAPAAVETGGRPPARRYATGHRVALSLLAVVLAATVGFDAATRADVHRTQIPLVAADHRLDAATATLASTVSAAVATGHLRDQRRASVAHARSTITATEQQLGATLQTSGLQAFGIATLQDCIGGVNGARSAEGSSDLPGTDSSLTGASAVCLSSEGSSSGLAFPFDFPDPSVLSVGSRYYAFSTNSVTGNVQVIESPDLVHWTALGDALPALPGWAQPGRTWAPSVLQLGSAFVLFYTVDLASNGVQCISEATAAQPQGPYVDASGGPLVCQLAGDGSIDPSPFVGADGTPYLAWMSYGTQGQPSTLWSQQLSPDGTALAPGTAPTALLRPSESWQHGYIEGPDMVLSGGHYVLFYSAADWRTSDYAIGSAACAGPLGPCTQASGQPVLASQGGIAGPGGPSVFTDASGNLWLAFHAWLPGYVGYPNSRMLFLRRITITDGVPRIGP
jgi:hypothetical protein